MSRLLDSGFEEVGGLEEDCGKDARPQTSYKAFVKSAIAVASSIKSSSGDCEDSLFAPGIRTT